MRGNAKFAKSAYACGNRPRRIGCPDFITQKTADVVLF